MFATIEATCRRGERYSIAVQPLSLTMEANFGLLTTCWAFWYPFCRFLSLEKLARSPVQTKLQILIWAKLTVFWGNDPESVLIAKNSSIWLLFMYCLCLVSFAKSYIFWDKLWNCQFKFASFCVQDQPGLGLKNRDHPRTRFIFFISLYLN